MNVKRKIIICVVLMVILDQLLPRIGDKLIRNNIEKIALTEITKLNGVVSNGEIPKNTSQKLCQFHRTMLAYLYQECFQSIGNIFIHSQNMQGFRLRYYKPKPFLTFFLPARKKDSYYFQESYLGEEVLRVATNGTASYIRVNSKWEAIK